MSNVRLHVFGLQSKTRSLLSASFPGAVVWHKAWCLFNRREKGLVVVVLSMMILGAISTTVMVAAIFPFLSILANPGVIQENEHLRLIDEYVGFSSPYHFLVATGVVASAVIFVASMIQILNLYVLSRFFLTKMHSMSVQLLEIYLHQPYELCLQRHTGTLSTTILDEAQQVVNRFFIPAGEWISSAIMVAVMMAFMFFVDPLVTIASIVIFGGTYGTIYVASRVYVERLGQKRRVANEKRFVITTEATGGIKDMKILGREKHYSTLFAAQSMVLTRSHVGMRVLTGTPRYLIQTLAFTGVIIVCLFMINQQNYQNGTGLNEIIPVLGTFALAGQRLLPEFQKLFGSAMEMQYGTAAVKSIAAAFKTRRATEPVAAMLSPLRLQRHLRFDAISYHYPGSSRPELTDIELAIGASERIGIVGETGAGKTTLVDVMLGLLRPQKGRILIDDVEVSEANMKSWQANIGYVPQNIFLTDASIAENIALGLPRNGIDQESVERAARFAQLDTFIRGLPDGYATKVGERGVRLSGGQVQRIGIARALIRDPDLIVFDEATSALDTMIEHEIMNAINALSAEKTVVMIAHRLSTLRCCNRIAVIEAGRLVGFDSWSNLEKSNAAFQRLLLATA